MTGKDRNRECAFKYPECGIDERIKEAAKKKSVYVDTEDRPKVLPVKTDRHVMEAFVPCCEKNQEWYW